MTVAELLDSPEKWTQGHTARNAAGEVSSAYSPDAVCWCLTGAVYKVCELNGKLADTESSFGRIRDALGSYSIAAWNDDPRRTFADVRAVIEKAGI